MGFAALGLSEELLRAVEDSGYTEPTPIQAKAIPPTLMGKDLIGIAQTGTGKTASFVLPMIDILAQGRSRARMPRSLILAPTRELAQQVSENFEKYGKYHNLSMVLLIGGVQMGDQVKALDGGVDVLIATPGRLLDLFERGKILLTACDLLVIDEADRMLDMGFIPDIESICLKLPKQRQTLLFSATMPPPIKKLADRFLTDPKTVEVARAATTNKNIEQVVVPVTPRDKRAALREILRLPKTETAIVFCNRKTTVRELATSLKRSKFNVGQIQGDMDQANRIAELDRFKAGEINVLVASDVAARGLDVKGVSTVVNYDVPFHPDDYVHRIGRTGRAGATGTAYTLVTPADEELIDMIEKLTQHKIKRVGGSAAAAKAQATSQKEPARDKAPSKDEQAPSKPRRKAAEKDAPKKERAPRREAKKAKDEDEGEPPAPSTSVVPTYNNDWNGPLPDFLHVGTKG
ncbi:DEAD/DEAH box helicase [Sphingomicrobium astaxanthinifaciens]|uniref:DEAD/DEAH box helicase n=1 Tax=Sphingomicrobium astaxanthinifaciens TaxID=1227949 RepID=UPI001FCB633C|nr:DEAD/DEAH box helicase [Sphingomicrobium astaxanthinifaciens]MCJ7420596.1 DEAD/DEAH box helicase [Sphingomicrobium astaxanthinifaciens]